jgi:hypothetical protein
MDFQTGRPDHIEDYLAQLHAGQWFGWSDSKNKIYTNLILHSKMRDSSNKEIDNPHSKPSEADCTAGLKALQDAWDLENDSYKSKRRAEYPSIADQLDDMYNNGFDAWKATIKATKDKYPKG